MSLRQRQRKRHTERQRDTHRDSARERHTETHRDRERETHTQTERKSERETETDNTHKLFVDSAEGSSSDLLGGLGSTLAAAGGRPAERGAGVWSKQEKLRCTPATSGSEHQATGFMLPLVAVSPKRFIILHRVALETTIG